MSGVPPLPPASSRPESSGRGRRAVRLVVLGAAGLGVFWLVARQFGGLGSVATAFRQANPVWVGVAGVGLLVAVSTAVLRWTLVLRAMGYSVGYGVAFRTVLSTMPLAIVAPSRANDLLRAHAIRDLVPPFATVGSVLTERAIDVQSLWILAALGAASIGRWELSLLACAGIVALWGSLLAILRGGDALARRWKKHGTKIDQVLVALRAMKQRPGWFGIVTVASLAAWLCNVAILYSLTLAYGADVRASDVFALWPLALFVGLLPVTFGGLGTRDAAFVYLLGLFATRAPNEGAVLAATLTYAVSVTWGFALLGSPFLAMQLKRSKAVSAPER